MKKVILSAFVAAAALFATSCTKDATETQIAATGDASVAFTVNAPALGSRAYGDGKTAKELVVLVYDKNGYRKDLSLVGNKALQMRDDLTQEAKIEKLIKGEKYSFLFWASANGATELVAADATAANDKLFALTVADGNVKVNYAVGKSNNENFDAFFANRNDVVVENAINETITLKRPFAQVNVGVDDKAAAIAQFGTDAFAAAQSMIQISKYDIFNLKNGEVDAASRNDVAIDAANIPAGEIFPVAGYDYMLMDYILVPTDKEVLDKVTITISGIADAAGDKVVVVNNVPVQRNYRTNIIGSLFTTSATFNVVIDPIFYEDADASNIATILSKNGSCAVVDEDMNARASLYGSATAPINSTLLLQNGATITNPVNSKKPATFYVSTYTNLTITGKGTIKANPDVNAPSKRYTTAIDIEATTAVVTIDGDDNLIIDGGSGDSKVCACAYVMSGTLNIKGGYFKTGLDKNGYQNPCILADGTNGWGSGTVNIYGGYFINETSADDSGDKTKIGVLNVEDGTNGKILCYGGTFVGQDPAKGDNSGTPSTFLAPGYKSQKLADKVDGKDVYEVVKE